MQMSKKAKLVEDVAKVLTITLQDGVAKYTFEGDWRGRDITNVHNHLYREYRVSQRSVRREQPLAETKQEVSDARPE